jgi:hypothetical protein
MKTTQSVCMVCGSTDYTTVSYGEFIPILLRCERCYKEGRFLEVDRKDVEEVSKRLYEKWISDKMPAESHDNPDSEP